MKYLFIVQGEGRGHMTQALVLENMLRKHGHEVAEIFIGKSPHREIPAYFKEKAQSTVTGFDSPNFSPAGKGQKISIFKTLIDNFRKSPQFLNSFKFLEERIEYHQPDVVVNFYDLIAGLLFEIKRPKVRFVCIAHQYFFLHPHFNFPKPNKKEITTFLYYTKLTCRKADKILALSLGTQPRYSSRKITIVPPLLRPEVFGLQIREEDFISGYLLNAGFEEQVRDWHAKNPQQALHFFSDRKQDQETEIIDETLSFSKLNDTRFMEMLASGKAYATTGGFESVCEALYLEKPVLMVPSHIEQYCNVIDAERAGAGIGAKSFNLDILMAFIPSYHPDPHFKEWVSRAETIFINELT